MVDYSKNEYAVSVVRVIDGDTVVLSVDLGFKVTMKVNCRLEGIDAPEKRQKGGSEAAKALERLLNDLTQKGYTFYIRSKKPIDKYGRWLVTIYSTGLGISINDWMVKNNYAVKTS